MTMTFIASVANPGGSVMSFTNIPQTFSHLQLRVFIRSTFNGNENLFMRFNNNFSLQFAGHGLIGDGSSATSNSYTGANFADTIAVPNAAQSANIFGAYIIDILDYTNTNKNKTIRTIGGFDANGSGQVQLKSNLILTTGAITEITQLGGTATVGMATGTRADLYGIGVSAQTGA